MSTSNGLALGLLTQKQIAAASGHEQSTISKIVNGDRIPSIKMAEDLERATGICREGWLYPNRHWNPYIPFTGLTSCLSCQNRGNRTEFALKVIVEDFKVHRDFQRMADIAIIYNGLKGLIFRFLECVPEGFIVLGQAGDPEIREHFVPKELPLKFCPARHQHCSKDSLIVSCHYPENVPQDFVDEIKNSTGRYLKSALLISRSKLCYTVSSYTHHMYWTDEIIKAVCKAINEVTSIFTTKI